MRVCLLNDSFPPVIDGVVNVVLNYAKYLTSGHGASVEVGCPRYPDTDYSVYPYQVVPYRSFDTTAFTSGYRTGYPFAAKAVSALAQFQPDLIHTHCPASSTVIARLLREDTGAPVVFTYHTKYDIDIRRVVKLEPVAREGIRIMVRNIEACDEIWVVSKGAGESLKALGFAGDYRVMHNGVDFEKGRAGDEDVKRVCSGYDLPDGIPVFLFVGRLMTYKGLPMILDALHLLAQTGQDFRMVFVGKGPDRELLEKQAEKLDLSGKCIFTGPVYDREELRAWNTRADLFLFPSTFDTNGLVVREAAACGLASVLIKDSCAAEGITDGHNGFVIDETPESMASLLQKLCKDPAAMHRAGERAMEEIYLSWQSCVAQAYDRYAAILEEKKGGRLPAKKKMPSDYLVTATAYGINEREKLRRIGHEMFFDFKETATGMMENMQEYLQDNSPERLQEKLHDRIQESGSGHLQEKIQEYLEEHFRKE